LELPAAGNRPGAEDAAIVASFMDTTLGWFTSAVNIKVTLLVKEGSTVTLPCKLTWCLKERKKKKQT